MKPVFFQPPWYRRTASFWVMSAKHEETRMRRLQVLIGSWEKGERDPPHRWSTRDRRLRAAARGPARAGR